MTEALLDQAFRALADPTRRRLLERLTAGPVSVGDLAAPLPMTLSAVMQHVRVLEAGGLVRTRKDGRVRTCTLDAGALAAAQQWLADRRVGRDHRLDRPAAAPDEQR